MKINPLALHFEIKKTFERRRKRMGMERLRCNLCNKLFRAASKFHRFCRSCKLDDELFRFVDTLPTMG